MDNTINIEKYYGFFDKNNRWNPIVIIDGESFRQRIECLIIKDDNKLFLGIDSSTGDYIIPGGGVDKYIPDEDQVANECKEEARIIVKEIQSTGITYIEKYDNINLDILNLPKEQIWIGTYNEIFVANYSKIYRGNIYKVDKDNDMINGKFYNISDIYHDLKGYWKTALCLYFGVEEAVKFYKNPSIQIKRKNTIINNKIKQNHTKDKNKNATQENTFKDDDIKKVAENAKKLLSSEIFACKDCAYVYYDIMTPIDDNKFAIIGWNLKKLKNNDEIQFPKCRDAVFSYCKKKFDDTNKGYTLNINNNTQCWYIVKI